jgi:hypothetical protein
MENSPHQLFLLEGFDEARTLLVPPFSSNLLFLKETMGIVQGVRNVRTYPPISHLLFKDDSIFFARSESRSVEALKETPIVKV